MTTTETLPYELLARFNHAGRLAGIHVQYRTLAIATDGAVLADAPGPVMPLESAAGFPLTELLDRLQSAAG